MTAFRFDVDRCDVRTGPERTTFDLDAADLAAAEHEAKRVLDTNRQHSQTGHLYRDGAFVRLFTWTAATP